jgi:hypothetical protein
MINMLEQRWEIGSEFDWSDHLTTPFPEENWLPDTYKLFATGTSTLIALHHLLSVNHRSLTLHLPSFFCMEVVAKLKTVFNICWYQDLPTEPAPNFSSLRPSPGDLVLAVNLFGIREGRVWRDWFEQHDDIVLIEDHSHDPFSLWAQQSTAHYALASLRKTLPIPDGGIIWSPQNLELPEPSSPESAGASQKLAAMILKRAYLDGSAISKDIYRLIQIQAEQQLHAEMSASASSFTSHILKCLDVARLRRQREDNIKQFLQLSRAIVHPEWHPLFTTWSVGFVPLNSILICRSHEIREQLREFLISQNIFPAIHWQQPFKTVSTNDPFSVDLSTRILTIPTDYRYSVEDVNQIVSKLVEFSSNHNFSS